MINILLSGCNGTMGKVITEAVSLRTDCQIVAGIDIRNISTLFPVFDKASDVTTEEIDVIINFSHPSSVKGLAEFASNKKIPLVESTTGLQEEQIQLLTEASQKTAIFFSANMSLGVNLLIELAKKATQILGNQFDIEIIEKHHNKKLDAPSGTALMIANSIAEEISPPPSYVYDRHTKREPRSKNEIGIHAIRGGTIVGEHEIIFAGQDEIITLSHSAMSKEVFATGAINAAIFLAKQPVGMYSMKDLLNQ